MAATTFGAIRQRSNKQYQTREGSGKCAAELLVEVVENSLGRDAVNTFQRRSPGYQRSSSVSAMAIFLIGYLNRELLLAGN